MSSDSKSEKGDERAARGRRRQIAGDTTYRESEYIDWLSKNHIPIVVKLIDGEEVRGWIEYYDREMFRLTRHQDSNLFIYKDRVKYLYEEDGSSSRRSSPRRSH